MHGQQNIKKSGNNVLHTSLTNAVLLVRTANNAGLLDKVVYCT